VHHDQHKLNEIEAISDLITIIRDGKIEPRHPRGRHHEDRIIRGMVGRDLDHRYPPHTPSIGDVVLEVKDWTVAHPDDMNRLVVKNASITIRAGEIVGLAGLMGAGRTEFARRLFGQSYGHKVSGTIAMDGKQVNLRSVGQAIGGLAYLTEDRVSGLNLLDTIRVSTTGGRSSRRSAPAASWISCREVSPRRSTQALRACADHRGGRRQAAATSRRSCSASGCSPSPRS
jgi:putative multiple sugar transport system ATP-binding protein